MLVGFLIPGQTKHFLKFLNNNFDLIVHNSRSFFHKNLVFELSSWRRSHLFTCLLFDELYCKVSWFLDDSFFLLELH